MTPAALVVTGENDAHAFFASRSVLRADAYTESPALKTNLELIGAEHVLRSIFGFDAAETSDENPERFAVLRAMIWAANTSPATPPGPMSMPSTTVAFVECGLGLCNGIVGPGVGVFGARWSGG
ncbi:MAG: hypothetical protein M3Z66_15365 [Chloroflexota bacterium]|nr:hypothetical protein [Chloroflexota bacterium]